MKEVVVCVYSVVGKKKSLVQLKYVQNKETSFSLLVFLISKVEVEMDEPISHLPDK